MRHGRFVNLSRDMRPQISYGVLARGCSWNFEGKRGAAMVNFIYKKILIQAKIAAGSPVTGKFSTVCDMRGLKNHSDMRC